MCAVDFRAAKQKSKKRMSADEVYCLGTFPNAQPGWLWVEGNTPWGGLYEKSTGLHNGKHYWFRQTLVPSMGTCFIYHRLAVGWVLDATHLVTTNVTETTKYVPLWPMKWPRTGLMRLTDPNGRETADRLHRVWEMAFFERYRTVLSERCRNFCNYDDRCISRLKEACKGDLDVYPASVCECFRTDTFYAALAEKLISDTQLTGATQNLLDLRPQCLWSPCRTSSVRRSTQGGDCPDLAICNAKSEVVVEAGGLILTNSLDNSATCLFDVNGNFYQIDNSNASQYTDGLVTGRGGNSRTYFQQHYGFDLNNRIVVLVLLMIALAIGITLVAAAAKTK